MQSVELSGFRVDSLLFDKTTLGEAQHNFRLYVCVVELPLPICASMIYVDTPKFHQQIVQARAP